MMTGFRTMAGLAVAGLMLTACVSKDLNNGNDQGYGNYFGTTTSSQPYTMPSQAPSAPASDAEAEAPAAESH
jgi:hypothetical protein